MYSSHPEPHKEEFYHNQKKFMPCGYFSCSNRSLLDLSGHISFGTWCYNMKETEKQKIMQNYSSFYFFPFFGVVSLVSFSTLPPLRPETYS